MAGLILGYVFVLPTVISTALLIAGMAADAGDPSGPLTPTDVGSTAGGDAGFGAD